MLQQRQREILTAESKSSAWFLPVTQVAFHTSLPQYILQSSMINKAVTHTQFPMY